ncbi:sulfite exporter TauE/SafE family protein [Salinibacterium sp. PAMC 21357]|uniref:sulfite exporter TauE/SafE family protein n=1 Tax=Salinibacterium sp. PAMC 21357 TaxID=1112215 RepID=UPI0002889DB6|nr:sulfite exporter TauE/SafE family protein [Salinibacterium sp. PAMC 21357]
MMSALTIALAVLVGALTQRLTGVGFALVASPLLLLALGPVQGVVLTNIFGVATALSVFVFHVRDIEYRRVLPLLGAAAIAVIPGALLARSLPSHVLEIGAGSLVILALALSVLAKRVPHVRAWPGQVVAGALSGFMNVIAGVGGPAITAYAVASEWEHRRFAISVQFYFATLGSLSLIARGTAPALSSIEWIAAITALVAGLLGGQLLTRWVPTRAARVFCLVLASLGGVAVIARGIFDAS